MTTWDNALAESFFAALKGELIDTQPWPGRPLARRAVADYIGRYNGTRLHSTLGYRSPADFEERANGPEDGVPDPSTPSVSARRTQATEAA